MGRIELDEVLFRAAAASAAAAAVVMYGAIAGDSTEAEHEASIYWFAGGLVRDRDQDEDLLALARYAAELRREPETLFRKAVELGVIEAEARAFDEQAPEVRLAYEIFSETARNAAVILDDQAKRGLEPPKFEAAPVKVEDTIFERSDADSGQDPARAAGVDAAAAHRKAVEAEAAKVEAAEKTAAAERDEAEQARAAKAAEAAKTQPSAKAKPARGSKGRTKVERQKAEETKGNG